MRAVTAESILVGLRWLRIAGDRESVFRTLGALTSHEVNSVVAQAPELPELRKPSNASRADRIIQESRRRLPEESREIDLIAEGADVDRADLWLLNLRGDLGHWGEGCSTFATNRTGGPIVCHNEDGHLSWVGKVVLVSLEVEHDPPVFAFHYPGLLPAVSFWIGAQGLVAALNHIPANGRKGVGRHLVARRIQRSRSAAEAIMAASSLRAGGSYAVTLATRSGGVVVVEFGPAGTHVETADQDRDRSVAHTNHYRWLGGCTGDADSRERLRFLTCLLPVNDAEEAGSRLRDPELLRNGAGPGRLTTHCSAVLDLASARAHLQTTTSTTDLGFGELIAGPVECN